MRRFKRVLTGSGLVGLLGPLALAAPAQASDVKGACVVDGEAKVRDKEDPSLPSRLFGGKGNFTFHELIVACAGVSTDAPDAQIIGVRAVGSFDNTICGTGKAWGTVDNIAGPEKYQELVEGRNFAIHFVGLYPESTGVFFWHQWQKSNLPALKDEIGGAKEPDNKDYQPAGSLRLTLPTEKMPPQLPYDPPGACTKAFHVYGVVLVHF